MHFTASTHAFSNNREVIDRLGEDVSDYEKNTSIYGSIKERTCIAVGNAERFESFHNEMRRRQKHVDRNPGSEVYRVLFSVCAPHCYCLRISRSMIMSSVCLLPNSPAI